MKIKWLFTLLFLFGLSLAVTAQDDFPDDLLEDGAIEVSNPELLLEIDFSDEDDWEFYEDDEGSVQVDERDEVYVIEDNWDANRAFLWGQDPEVRVFGDIVIQVEAEQLSREDNNGYGVMCRADPSNNGQGYRFYVSGDGWVSISVVTEDEISYLYEWEESDAVNQGEEVNELVVVCVDEYLGFYVNGELVAEAEDDTYEEGVIAFAATIYEEDGDIEVAFDNLLVWEVESESSSNDEDSNEDEGDSDSGRTNTTGRGSNEDESSSDIDIEDLTDEVASMLEDGDVEIELEDVLLVETWDELGEWEEFDEDDYVLGVEDDTYVILNTTETNLVWGLNRTEHDDVVMQVQIEQLSDGDANGFGLMCRVDTENFGDGYSFLVRPNGTYSIGYWEDNSYFSLIDDDFASNSDIDDDGTYTMTIVCVGEYLALYIDGELIDELEDDTYDEGYAGVAAVSFEEDGVEAAFDNLIIWEAND